MASLLESPARAEPAESLVSMTGARGLRAALGAGEFLLQLSPSRAWRVPAPASVFGEADGNYSMVAQAFKTTRVANSAPVYLALLRDALVSPSGVVFRRDGRVVYESLFPWQIENFMTQFAASLRVEGARLGPSVPEAEVQQLDLAVHCREGGETGYFHFINSILPRIGALKRAGFGDAPEVLVSRRQPFAARLLDLLGVAASPHTGKWLRANRLVYLSPFTYQGDHFTRPPFASVLLREVLAAVLTKPGNGRRRLYLSRADTGVRRLANEEELLGPLRERGFERVTIGDMPIERQIALFSEAHCLVSAHGAGLSNMVFMPEGSSVVEIVSPARLWPTFRMLAARHSRRYHAVIGSSHDASQTAARGAGNEDFRCSPAMLRLALNEALR